MGYVDKIIRFENGEMDEDEVIEFFQELVNSGLAWRLQGSYGRMAHNLIINGLVNEPKQTEVVNGN